MALQANKFEMKIRQDDDSFVCDITNGSICLSVSNDGEEEDMQAIVDALNKPNVRWYSNNKLELDQHIEIMQLQGERDQWKVKYDELDSQNDETLKILSKFRMDVKNAAMEYQALKQQHQQLKEKSEKLAAGVQKAYGTLIGGTTRDRADTLNILNRILSSWKEGKEVTDKQRLARTVVAIAEEVSKDAESAEAYLKSEGVDVEKVKADAAYFAWKSRLMAIVTEHTGHTAVINDEEARKWYTDGFTPGQCFRETWQSDGD